MLLIYTPYNNKRIEYVFRHIFNLHFGLEYELTNDKNYYQDKITEAKFIYSTEKHGNSLFFFATSFLQENTIKKPALNTGSYDGVAVLFAHENKDSAIGFDLFAAVFYLVSRYEEYIYKGKDDYGNFDYRQSILHKLNTLHIPLADLWIQILKTVLINNFPALKFKEEKPSYILSFDVDVAFEYKNRTLKRTAGGLIKKIVKLQFRQLKEQIITLMQLKADAFDTYDYILQNINESKALWFFNMGKYREFDKNPHYKNKAFRNLILDIAEKNLTGLHPSYASNYDSTMFAKEKKRLESIIDKKVFNSRQHYLKLSLPDTYQLLINNGILNDFTMGYYFHYGFRAGTCRPFNFFNLAENKTTNLIVYPFAYMDGTLNDILHLSTADARKIISNLISTVKHYNGMFIPLWHNSTLSESGGWKGWRNVFEYTVEQLKENDFISLDFKTHKIE